MSRLATTRSPPGEPGLSGSPVILWLDDPRAEDASQAGAKAANLARSRRAGLPVLPGFALTTSAVRRGAVDAAAVDPLRQAWERLTDDGSKTVVVRSSSTVEDSTTSSMAGQFTTLLGVRGWEPFLDAVAAVLRSAARPRDAVTHAQPMAVLVQPQLDPRSGGVLFGVDPVSGDRGHVVVEAVRGTPDALVSGTATASHCALTRRGRLVGRLAPADRALLPLALRRRLARLARDAATAFGGPQDVEWAVDDADRLWLLQARSVTATGRQADASGPILGPGPVAETFPDPLRPLEIELWVDPLRQGVAGAVHVTGAVGRRRIERSPVVTTVGGRVAADLELFGIVPGRSGLARLLNPLPSARRLLSAWRVGRLRAALPSICGDLLASVDAELTAVDDLTALDDGALLALVEGSTAELAALHGHEVLAGILLDGEGDRSTAAALALVELARGRAEGLADASIVARTPVVLALRPPSIGPVAALPAVAAPPAPVDRAIEHLGCREALRLRCRWVQELSAQAARELAARLVAAGVLQAPEDVALLSLAELRCAVDARRAPDDLDQRRAAPASPPLPTAFRLDPAAVPHPVSGDGGAPDGLPASAGRGLGVVCHDADAVVPNGRSVLVVDTLDPRLAAVLPGLAGLVSETGSALSHLAILAREGHVPAVVAVPEARARFPVGAEVLVDGTAGRVHRTEEDDR